MKYNKLFKILLLVSILIVCLTAVSAAEDINASMVKTDDSNMVVENNGVSDTLKSANDDDVLSDGNAWYVKNGATGGDGSESKPFGNLKSVINNANYKENDVIYIMEGTYTGSSNYGISLKENTTVMAYNDAKPIFDAKNIKSVFVLSNNGITIKGLTLINGGGSVIKTTDGKDAYCGGAIVNSGDNLLVEDCIIKNNDPVSYGGGIYSKGKNTQIKYNTFEGCDAGYGGAIAIDGPYAKIINNTFNNNRGTQGAAVNIYNYGYASIVNNSFSKNSANKGHGGAICARAGSNYIANNTFERNTAKSYGGAIITVNPNNVIDNCTFISNQIFNANSNTNWGGAIYSQGANTQILNSKFYDNAVRDNGGAIYVRNNDNLIQNCTFDKNWAARGGAIYIAQVVSNHNITNTTINNCTFNENGVIEEQDGEPNLGTKGGAIYSWGIDTHVYNSDFNNNKAMIGGAILYERGHNYLENNTFTGNKAYRYGGGAISSTRFGDTINNCTFTDNFAQGYGGAVSADYPTITNSTFINNHANHGGAICTIIADVSDSKFYENSADDNWVVLAATKLIESNNIHPGQVALSMNHTTYLTMDYDVENEIAIMPGYYAYCMEEYADYPQYGVLWENLRYAQNSLSEERVGEYLKILILKYWNDETQHGNLQKLVNMFTDHEFKSSDNEIVQEIMSLYDSGYRVPTVNALRVYDNGTVAIFNFKEIITPSGTQNVFAFNITYNPNLTVKKEVITNPVINGKQVEFNITVKNEGKCNLTYAWINETSFSNGLIYSSFNSKFNWTYDKQAKIWTLNDTLTPNATANIILIFNVTKAGEMNNTVSVGIGNYTFKNDTVKFTVYAPKLAVEKLTLTKFVYIGNQTVFTIIIKNTGDYDLKDVFVVEKSYDGLKYNSYNGEKWIKQGDKYIYNDVLAKGKSASFNITFDTVKAGNFTNIVIAGSNITENQTANNTTTVYKPGLKVEKITLTQNVKIGSLTSFKIIVTNTGDCKLGSIFVYEKYDQGLIYYEFTGDKWSKKGDIFKYSGELNPGESASFTVFFNTTRVGEFTNSVIAGSNVTNNETTQNNTVVLENHTNPLNKSNNTILNKSSKNTILNKSEIPKKEIKTNIKNATGNPLMALFAVFLIVGGFGIRKRK